MHCFLKHLIGDCAFLIVVSTASLDAEPPGFAEGTFEDRKSAEFGNGFWATQYLMKRCIEVLR